MPHEARDTRPANPDSPDDHALAAAPLEPPAWDRTLGAPAAWTFVACFLAWMLVVFTVWTTWPGQDHGTRMADSNILNAGNVYATRGFDHRHAIPQLETYEDDERRPVLYGTYPPGPYWVHAAVRLSGIDDVGTIRGVSVIGATVAGLLGLVAFSVLARSWLVGAVAAAFYCFSAPFSGYADSVHMNVWMQIILFAFLMAWVGFERVRGPWRWGILALAGLAYFAQVWMTLEQIGLIAIVVAVRTILSRRWSVWIGGAILAGVCVLGLASRFWHLHFEFGSFDGAREYLLGKYQHRSGEGNAGRSGVSLADVARQWLGQLHWSEAGESSRKREFGYPLLATPVLLSGGLILATMIAARARFALGQRVGSRASTHTRSTDVLADSKAAAIRETRLPAMRAPRAAIGWGLLLLLASLHWHLWMRQHASIHPHIILNMLPGMALILGGLASAGVRLAMDDARPAGMIRWLGLPLAAALTVAFASHLQYAAALNRLLPINRDMHAELNARARADQWWTDLGDALERRYGHVRRVVLYHWGPRQANRMGLPHQYVEGGQMPEQFGGQPTGVIADMPGVPPDGTSGGADLLMVEHPRRAKTPRVILEEGFDRFGFPEIDQGPESTTLFFSNRRWAGAPDAIPTDIRFTGGLRIDAVRLTETVTGDAFVLCMLVRGPNGAAFLPERHGVRAIDEQAADDDAGTNAGLGGADASQDAADATSPDEDGESVFDDAPEQAILPTRRPPDSIFALVRTFDADGQRTGVYSPMLASQALFRNRALVWMVIDKHRLPRGGSLRISLTPLRREGRIDIRSAPTLGPGMSLDSDAGEIVWEVVRP